MKFNKNLVISSCMAAAVGASFLTVIGMWKNTDHLNSNIEVAYTADPTSTENGPLILGYPNHRFSVTCSSNGPKSCLLEIDQDGKSIVKYFPYVEQEWFNPRKDNRPWHSLDTIKDLPSYNKT